MMDYKKMAQIVAREVEIKHQKKKKRIAEIKRVSLTVSGVCVAIIVYFGVWNNERLKNVLNSDLLVRLSKSTVTDSADSDTEVKYTSFFSQATTINADTDNKITVTTEVTNQSVTDIPVTQPVITYENNVTPESSETLPAVTETEVTVIPPVTTVATKQTLPPKITSTVAPPADRPTTTVITSNTNPGTIVSTVPPVTTATIVPPVTTVTTVTPPVTTATIVPPVTTTTTITNNTNTGTTPVTNSYGFYISFLDDNSFEAVNAINARLIQQKIEWIDDVTRVDVGEGVVVAEWNSSDHTPYYASFIKDETEYRYIVIVDTLPSDYNFSGQNFVEYNICGCFEGDINIDIMLSKEQVTTNSIPLEGTYSLRLKVLDIVSNMSVPNLECELFCIQTREVVASWNTSTTEELYIENLRYSFDKPDSYNGNITYAIRIKNMPENYCFFYGKSKTEYGISGFGLEEFANGTELICVAYLENTSEDALKYRYY